MPDIVRVEHLSYIYGQGMPDATVALHDISFSIEQGSFCLLYTSPSPRDCS